MLLYSIIIPTFNRIELIDETIQSAVDFIAKSECSADIIIVDDGSEDGTYEHIEKEWKFEINDKLIRLVRNENNLGVACARNRGVHLSHSHWVVFLDSDDLLIPEKSLPMTHTLKQSDQYPIVFFRCITLETNRLIGPQRDRAYELCIKQFLNNGTPGECLPAIKTKYLIDYPYDEGLNGCEGITYAAILEHYGCARVEPLIVRKYRTRNSDRLSVGDSFRARKGDIRAYHKKILLNYTKYLRFKTIVMTMLKMLWYSLNMLTRRLLEK